MYLLVYKLPLDFCLMGASCFKPIKTCHICKKCDRREMTGLYCSKAIKPHKTKVQGGRMN